MRFWNLPKLARKKVYPHYILVITQDTLSWWVTYLKSNLFNGEKFLFLCRAFEFRCFTSTTQHRRTLYALILFTTTAENIYCIMQYTNLQKAFFEMSSSSLSRQPASDPGLFKISPPDIRPLLFFPILLYSAAKRSPPGYCLPVPVWWLLALLKSGKNETQISDSPTSNFNKAQGRFIGYVEKPV